MSFPHSLSTYKLGQVEGSKSGQKHGRRWFSSVVPSAPTSAKEGKGQDGAGQEGQGLLRVSWTSQLDIQRGCLLGHLFENVDQCVNFVVSQELVVVNNCCGIPKINLLNRETVLSRFVSFSRCELGTETIICEG